MNDAGEGGKASLYSRRHPRDMLGGSQAGLWWMILVSERAEHVGMSRIKTQGLHVQTLYCFDLTYKL